ncbi:MAG: hypothetical protein CME59_16490 [Halioglobus sp.]|nr:hypothetical protein [Halioglobus sp.]|tara:strand:- start:8783 stop:8983 length:201 start_codon:yes stop_codon:yes gene_type:complete
MVDDQYEKQPWPATGIREGTSISDYDWGYLYIYADGRQAEFRIDEKPSEREILDRWGHYIRRNERE